MTPDQMATFRAGMNIRPGHEWDSFEGLRTPPAELASFLGRVPFNARGRAPLSRGAGAGSRALTVAPQAVVSTQTGFGQIMNEIARSETPLAERIVIDVAGRDRLDQSRALGQPPRPLRPRERRRPLPRGAHRLDAALGVLAEGPARRARHRRDEPLPVARRLRPLAFALRRAAPPGRHALRPVHRARPRCAELRLLPGRPLTSSSPRRRASRSRPRAARTSRSARR